MARLYNKDELALCSVGTECFCTAKFALPHGRLISLGLYPSLLWLGRNILECLS